MFNLVTILLEGDSVSTHYNVIMIDMLLSHKKKQSKLKLIHCIKQQNPSFLSHNLIKIKK